jgi:hypothetical protein
LQILWARCHKNKTAIEASLRKKPYSPLVSELNPYMWEKFHRAAKTMPQSGSWDTESGSSNPVYLDVCGCRSNALREYVSDIVAFSPLDDYERIFDDDGRYTHDLNYWDYIYVNVPDFDPEDPEFRELRRVYQGAKFYCLGWVLEVLGRFQLITSDNLVYGIRASVRRKPAELFEAVDEILTILKAELEAEKEILAISGGDLEGVVADDLDIEAYLKKALLAWIGL